jgi:hypothetical protein
MKKKLKSKLKYSLILIGITLLLGLIFYFSTSQNVIGGAVTKTIDWDGNYVEITAPYLDYGRISDDRTTSFIGDDEDNTLENSYIIEGNKLIISSYLDYSDCKKQTDRENYIIGKVTLPTGELKVNANSYMKVFEYSGASSFTSIKTNVEIFKLSSGICQFCCYGKPLERNEQKETTITLSEETEIIFELRENPIFCGTGETVLELTFEKKEVSEPENPKPSGWTSLLGKLIDFLDNLWDKLLKQSIVGETEVESGSTHTYLIELSTEKPDSDYSDGFYSIQYSNWALLDKEGNIINQGVWEETNGDYSKSLSLKTPTEKGQYALIGVITQVDGNYNYETGKWEFSEEYILNKEAIDIYTLYSVTEPENPNPSGFGKFISSILDFFKNIFGGLFN